MHLTIWLPILAVAFGFITHALSTDGGGSVLARFSPKLAIPKPLVYPLILVFGFGDGVFENVLKGSSWESAAAAGVTATLMALFGVVSSQHVTGRDANGRPLGVVGFVGGVVFMFVMQGCALFTPQNLPKTEEVTKDVLCEVEHAFVDDVTLDTVCNLLTPEQKAAGHAVAKTNREQIGRQLKAMRAEACDGGAK